MTKQKTLTKNEIKEHALNLIETSGFNKFSIRTLAQTMDIAPSTLYLYYEEKADLLFDLASDFWEKCFSSIEHKGATFFEKLENLYFHFLNYLAKFKREFIQNFTNLGLGQRHGKGRMGEYLNRILHFINLLLKGNSSYLNWQLCEKVGYDYLSLFIFNNFKQMLMNEDSDYEKFDTILKKILLIEGVL